VRRNPLLQFSSRKAKSPRLELAFRLVQRFVSRAKPALAWTKLRLNCREIVQARKFDPGKHGQRAFMHAYMDTIAGDGHTPNTICSLSLAESLPEGYLFGLLLHEFGHLGSGGGERDADRWILEKFGIRILYLGELDLEWVDQFAINRIIAGTTLPRRNPRAGRSRGRALRCPLPRRPRGVPIDPLL
jgi:hypothetical protein